MVRDGKAFGGREAAGPERRTVRVIGCGRRFWSDDQVGLLIAEALATLRPPQTEIETTEAPGAELFDGIRADDLLIVVDAAQAPDELLPGSLVRIDYRTDPGNIRKRRRTNTHTLSIDAALELGLELGILPVDVWIYAVAGEDFSQGSELSESVAKCVNDAVGRIRRDIDRWLNRPRPTGLCNRGNAAAE